MFSIGYVLTWNYLCCPKNLEHLQKDMQCDSPRCCHCRQCCIPPGRGWNMWCHLSHKQERTRWSDSHNSHYSLPSGFCGSEWGSAWRKTRRGNSLRIKCITSAAVGNIWNTLKCIKHDLTYNTEKSVQRNHTCLCDSPRLTRLCIHALANLRTH